MLHRHMRLLTMFMKRRTANLQGFSRYNIFHIIPITTLAIIFNQTPNMICIKT